MPKRDIIAIGGSTGSLSALSQIGAALPSDFQATLLVSPHMSPHSPSHLADLLSEKCALPVKRAVDGQPVERGHVYVAVPNYHLLVVDQTIHLGSGPRENMSRPAVDPLFRSAALSYGSRAVGVILSGMLNDGASGLQAIKAVGGTTIVQHPLDAEADEMPLAAIEATDADYVAPAAEMARMLIEVSAMDAGPQVSPSEGLALEVSIAAGGRLGADALLRIADPAPISCPDCHGVLSQVRGVPLRFRCQIGHAYTARALASYSDEVDEAMRVALRVMEERVTLVSRMADDARKTNRGAVAELYEARVAEYNRYAEVLRAAATDTARLGSAEREQDR